MKCFLVGLIVERCLENGNNLAKSTLVRQELGELGDGRPSPAATFSPYIMSGLHHDASISQWLCGHGARCSVSCLLKRKPTGVVLEWKNLAATTHPVTMLDPNPRADLPPLWASAIFIIYTAIRSHNCAAQSSNDKSSQEPLKRGYDVRIRKYILIPSTGYRQPGSQLILSLSQVVCKAMLHGD